MTKGERRYVGEVVSLGCIVCRREGYGISPAEVHHPRFMAGMGQRGPHKSALPLCHLHHRNGGPGVALHAGQETWEAKFGTEEELVKAVKKLMGKDAL